MALTVFLSLLLHFFVCVNGAGYTLTDDYQKHDFFNNFEAFTEQDPTQGFVQYHDYQVSVTNGNVGTVANFKNASYMGVDTERVTTTGRPSVRITSIKSYNHGLFIADIAHMPGGTCGVWPAFWMVGPDWPKNGEIDIIEGVNAQETNQMTLHTGNDCLIGNTGYLGKAQTLNCNNKAPNQADNAGCGIISQDKSSFGAGFNAIGGGVYATEWNSTAISIWFWPRKSIPSDISSGNPNPASWPAPMSLFTGSCDIDRNFKDLQIVFDTTFCGVWAGKDWGNSTCSSKASTCEVYVGQNPEAFKDAYWLVKSVKVYQKNA